jgi:hypothetical protein
VAHTDETRIAGMLAVIATTSWPDAVALLADQGHTIGETTLRQWCKDTHAVEFEKLREDWAPKIEAQLANDLLDTARLASAVEHLALQKAHEQLENGNAREPSKIARDASQVKSQSVDKRLALQGRPTQVTERRDVGEIVKALVGMKVLKIEVATPPPDATAMSQSPPEEAPQPLQLAQGPPESPREAPAAPQSEPGVSPEDEAAMEAKRMGGRHLEAV